MPMKMETKRTNKPQLVKGLNPEKPLYIPLVITGIVICGAAIYLGFKGIKIIMDSIFK